MRELTTDKTPRAFEWRLLALVCAVQWTTNAGDFDKILLIGARDVHRSQGLASPSWPQPPAISFYATEIVLPVSMTPRIWVSAPGATSLVEVISYFAFAPTWITDWRMALRC